MTIKALLVNSTGVVRIRRGRFRPHRCAKCARRDEAGGHRTSQNVTVCFRNSFHRRLSICNFLWRDSTSWPTHSRVFANKEDNVGRLDLLLDEMQDVGSHRTKLRSQAKAARVAHSASVLCRQPCISSSVFLLVRHPPTRIAVGGMRFVLKSLQTLSGMLPLRRTTFTTLNG